MPAGLLISLVSWFASHLVTWTLLGFLVAGLAVFGVLDVAPLRSAVPAPVAATEPAEPAGVVDDDQFGRVEAPVSPAAKVSRPQKKPAASPVAEDRLPEPESRRQPKLIGGSLPVYDIHDPQRGAAGGFRPEHDTTEDVVPPPDRDSLVQRAREAYWNGEFEQAEAAYMDVVTLFPDEPDPYGELGNLYEAMGQPQLARDAYFAAGVRLKRRGEEQKLNDVIDLLRKKGDDRASVLSRR